jgi:hypothetical protein
MMENMIFFLLKGTRRNCEQGNLPVLNREEAWSQTSRREGTDLRYKIRERRFRNINARWPA